MRTACEKRTRITKRFSSRYAQSSIYEFMSLYGPYGNATRRYIKWTRWRRDDEKSSLAIITTLAPKTSALKSRQMFLIKKAA